MSMSSLSSSNLAARARSRGPWRVLAPSAAVLALSIALSIATGALRIGLGETLRAIRAGITGAPLEGTASIVWTMRVPRVLMAALVGASLGASGGAMQGLFRNPLVDPYLLGLASGASFGVTLMMSITGSLNAPFGAAPFGVAHTAPWMPLAAFAGAVGAVLLCVILSAAGKRDRTTSLLLSGIVVSSMLISLTTYLLLRDADRLRAVVSWSLGSLSLSTWADLRGAAPYAAVGLVLLFVFARGLDALQLGPETARTMGIDVGRVRLGVIVGTSLATAAAVAFVGVIGFVGLAAPHIMRRLGPPQHRILLPASMLGGATLLVLADLGARTLVRPSELPVGIVTTLLGGPFFLWLLRRETPCA
jgi:iron complex transport system permease protein